jgi:hypothetical protein
MLISPFPGFNLSSAAPSIEILPAYGRSWSVQRATFTSSSSTQKYLIYKSYVSRDEPDTSINTTISDLVLNLSRDSTISDFEALSVSHSIKKSNHSAGHRLLTVQFHLMEGCVFCETGAH